MYVSNSCQTLYWVYLYMLFICAKFHGNKATIKMLQQFFEVCKKNNLNSPNSLKKKGKKQRKNTKVWPLIFHERLLQTLQNLLCGIPRWRAAVIQKLRAFQKGSWSYMHVWKIVIVLPVNIIAEWHASLLAAQHTTVCLDYQYQVPLLYKSVQNL